MVVPLPVNTHNNGSVNALARADVFADNEQPPQTQEDSEVQIVEKQGDGDKEQENGQDEEGEAQPMTNGVPGNELEYEEGADEAENKDANDANDAEARDHPAEQQPAENKEESPEKEDEEQNEDIDEEMADFIQPPPAADKEKEKDSDDDEPIIEDKNDDDFEPDEEEEDAPQVPEPQAIPSQPEQNLQENMEKSLDEELIELSTIQPGENHKTRLMIYDIDLEKIHFNVYKDNYVNPAQFVDDVSKIVHNAELDPSDQDRLWKAQQLLTHARVLVDQAFDGQFRIECQRMADRETKRIAEYKEKRKREKEAKEKEASKEKENAPGDGAADGQPGQQPPLGEEEATAPEQHAHPNGVAEQPEHTETGTSLKRPREGEVENGTDGPESKKAKGDVEMTESVGVVTPSNAFHLTAT